MPDPCTFLAEPRRPGLAGRGRKWLMPWLLVLCFLEACTGLRAGYRHDYRHHLRTGHFWGPYGHNYLLGGGLMPGLSGGYMIQGEHSFAHASLDAGIPFGTDLRQWRHLLSFSIGFEWGEGPAAQLSLCCGLQNTTELSTCGLWSSTGWIGADLGVGLFLPSLRDPRTFVTGK